jgi:hypothetical protein
MAQDPFPGYDGEEPAGSRLQQARGGLRPGPHDRRGGRRPDLLL